MWKPGSREEEKGKWEKANNRPWKTWVSAPGQGAPSLIGNLGGSRTEIRAICP